jgi:hypothetical protein
MDRNDPAFYRDALRVYAETVDALRDSWLRLERSREALASIQESLARDLLILARSRATLGAVESRLWPYGASPAPAASPDQRAGEEPGRTSNGAPGRPAPATLGA